MSDQTPQSGQTEQPQIADTDDHSHDQGHEHGDACGCGHDHHHGHHHAPVFTYKRSGPKVGRNDPCTCGSGKKHKKCCLRRY